MEARNEMRSKSVPTVTASYWGEQQSLLDRDWGVGLGKCSWDLGLWVLKLEKSLPPPPNSEGSMGYLLPCRFPGP